MWISGKMASTSVAKDRRRLQRRRPRQSYRKRGMNRKLARNQVVVPQTKVARTISTKDVIAVLEREPQMSKSTLIYRLYEKMRAEAVAE